MSLKPEGIEPVPEETARIARAASPKGNVCLRLRDTLGTIYTDHLLADLFPTRGQPAAAPWRLALVTVSPFVEWLSDRQAAEAVRARIDWKYRMSLPLSDPGFDDSVLSAFRTRLVAGGAELRRLVVLLEQCQARGWLKARGHQRTDSSHVLAAVRALNRLELVGETLRHALNVLAEVAPACLRDQLTPEWFERSSHRGEDSRLPKGKEARAHYALLVGADGLHLLAAVEAQSAPPGCARCQPSAAANRRGSSRTCRSRGRCAGRRLRHWRLLGSAQTRPTTRKPASATSARRPGLGIKCIGPRPAMRRCPI